MYTTRWILGVPVVRQCSGAAMPRDNRVCSCVLCGGLLVRSALVR